MVTSPYNTHFRARRQLIRLGGGAKGFIYSVNNNVQLIYLTCGLPGLYPQVLLLLAVFCLAFADYDPLLDNSPDLR